MSIDPSTEIRAADRYFSSHEVGNILQVTPSSVVKWINDGLLNAFRTPGGHRRVAATELVRFAQHHGMPIPDALRELAVGKVLVVDDEPKFLSALHRAFKPHDSEVNLQTTENGVDALMLIGSFKPDVLILDIRLPTLDGFEVLKRLRANPDTKHTVVIAMSGHIDAATSERCKKLGATMCLQKPVKVSELMETLRELPNTTSRLVTVNTSDAMLKSDLIALLVQQRKIAPEQAAQTVDLIFDSMKAALCAGQNIEIRGFGTFHVKHHRGYDGRNPRSGAIVPVKPKRGVRFHTGKELADRIRHAGGTDGGSGSTPGL